MSEGFAGMTAGQMESHPVEVLANLAPNLDEAEAPGPELEVRNLALCEPATEGIE